LAPGARARRLPGRAVWGALLALVVAIGVIATPAAARACSCVPPRLSRDVLPRDGAEQFPTDGVIHVFLTAFPLAARKALASEYRLRDAAGAEVPVDPRVVGTRLDLVPRAPLRPSTKYSLEQVFAFDEAGVRLGDTERIQRS